MNRCVLVVVCVMAEVAVCYAQAPDAGYIKDMPDPAIVLAGVRGRDTLDTLARQVAALTLLSDVISKGSPTYRALTRYAEEEKVLNGKYLTAASDLTIRAHATTGSDEAARAAWDASRGRYFTDQRFREEVLSRYLPASAPLKEFQAAVERDTREFIAIRQRREAEYASSDAAIEARILAALRGVTVGAGLLFLFGLAGEFRGSRLQSVKDGGQRFLTVGWRRYIVRTATGIAQGVHLEHTVSTFVSGTSTNVASTMYEQAHREFFIVHEGGELPIQLHNIDFAVRDGHQVSAIGAAPKRKQHAGQLIMLRNHSTNHDAFIDKDLRRLLRPRMWPLAAFLVAWWAAFLPPVLDAPTFESTMAGPVAVMVTFWGSVLWLIGRLLVGVLRARNLRARDLPALAATLQPVAGQAIRMGDVIVTPG